MKSNKGFTLIELLAVIVVLTIIALIAIPVITNVIDKARLGALKDSAYGILDAGELYIANNLKEGIPNNLTFTCNKNKCTSDDKEINYKGNINEGTLIITTDSKTLVCVDNGKNYALKLASDKDVTTGTGTCGSYEETNGSFNIISDIDTLRKELADLKEKLSQTNITANDITEGKIAYSNGEIITGTNKGNSFNSFTTEISASVNEHYTGYDGGYWVGRGTLPITITYNSEANTMSFIGNVTVKDSNGLGSAVADINTSLDMTQFK